MGFWTQLGLSGFRVDAVPFLLETSGLVDAEELPDPHDYLADLRAFLGRRCGDAVLLGEVNLPYADTMAFFGEDGGRRADHVLRLRRHAADVPGAGQGERRAPRRGAARPPGPACRRALGDVRPQPRRADPGQADRRAAQGGLRRVRPRGGHAALRARPAPQAAVDARRRPATGCGWSTACCSRCPARRCCSTARRSAWPRTSAPRDGSRCGPRCSGRQGRAAGSPRPTRRTSPGRSSRASSGPTTSTCATRSATRSPCWPGSGCSWSATARTPSSPGAGSRCWTRVPRRRPCWPIAATRAAGRCWRSTTWPVPRRSRELALDGLGGRELEDALVLGGEPVAVDEDGSATVELGPYGVRWLRTSS